MDSECSAVGMAIFSVCLSSIDLVLYISIVASKMSVKIVWKAEKSAGSSIEVALCYDDVMKQLTGGVHGTSGKQNATMRRGFELTVL